MTDYEKVLLEIVINAGEKIIDSMSLYKTGYSYRDSWYLAVIAEEEIAKLIILPFANFAGRLENVKGRGSITYKHPVKQKVFTTFGVQNRSHEEIENLKQNYLYVSPDVANYKPRPKVDAKEASREIIHAVKLFDQIAILNLLAGDTISEEFKRLLKSYFEKIFIPAVKQLHPAAGKEMIQKYDSPRPGIIELVKTHPQVFAEVIMQAIPNDYATYFTEIEGKSMDEAFALLEKYLPDDEFRELSQSL